MICFPSFTTWLSGLRVKRLHPGRVLPPSPLELGSSKLIHDRLILIHGEDKLLVHGVCLQPPCLHGRVGAEVVPDGRVGLATGKPLPRVLVELDLDIRVKETNQSVKILVKKLN